MTAFIEEHRETFGVELICRVLPIAQATYYVRAAITRSPYLAYDRAKRELGDAEEIGQIFKANSGRYGARQVWRQLRREQYDIARCAVERLMQTLGLQGVTRGK